MTSSSKVEGSPLSNLLIEALKCISDAQIVEEKLIAAKIDYDIIFESENQDLRDMFESIKLNAVFRSKILRYLRKTPYSKMYMDEHPNASEIVSIKNSQLPVRCSSSSSINIPQEIGKSKVTFDHFADKFWEERKLSQTSSERQSGVSQPQSNNNQKPNSVHSNTNNNLSVADEHSADKISFVSDSNRIQGGIEEMKESLKLYVKNNPRADTLPTKPKKLTNYILNNHKLHPMGFTDEHMDQIIAKVVQWWLAIDGGQSMICNENIQHFQNQMKEFAVANTSPKQLKTHIKTALEEIQISSRDYQEEIFEIAKKENIVCFMPTGSGKTRIAIKLILHRLQLIYNQKCECFENGQMQPSQKWIIFLVPTNHLAQQQLDAIRRLIPIITQRSRKVVGDSSLVEWSSDEWKLVLQCNDVLVMIHDKLLVALSHGYLKITDIDLLIFDECHHAVGGSGHPYTTIINKYQWEKDNAIESEWKLFPRILGLTASPVKTLAKTRDSVLMKLQDLTQMLDGRLIRIESEELDAAVADPTIVALTFINTEYMLKPLLPIPLKFKKMKKQKFVRMMKAVNNTCHEMGAFAAALAMRVLRDHMNCKNRFMTIAAQSQFSVDLSPAQIEENLGNWKDFASFLNENCEHFDQFLELGRFDRENPAWSRDISMKLQCLFKFINDTNNGINAESYDCKEFEEDQKLENESAVNKFNFRGQNNGGQEQQGIIFVERRMHAHLLRELLSIRFPALKFGIVVGHGTDIFGMSETQQRRNITQFRNGSMHYLIATSVAEEGMDIQACNCVIRFSLPKTAKEMIQARGRARNKNSRYVLFFESDNNEQLQRFKKFILTEQDMIIAAKHNKKSDGIWNRNSSKFDDGLYNVPNTGAFTNCVRSIHMLNSYMSFLKLPKVEPKYSRIHDEQTQHLKVECLISIHSDYFDKWPLDETEFVSSDLKKERALGKCCVDIIIALRESEVWNENLVPITIIQKNANDNKLSSKQVLMKSMLVSKMNVPQILQKNFRKILVEDKNKNISNSDDDDEEDENKNINNRMHDENVAQNKAGDELNKFKMEAYLYFIKLKDDPNPADIGILLPQKIEEKDLPFIKFPVKIRVRREELMREHFWEYANTINSVLANEENYNAYGKNSKSKKLNLSPIGINFLTAEVSLVYAQCLHINDEKFNQLIVCHQILFNFLGGRYEMHKRQISERYYILCPLVIESFMIDYGTVERIILSNDSKNLKNGNEWISNYAKRDLKYSVIRVRKSKKVKMLQTYICYGIHSEFSAQSRILKRHKKLPERAMNEHEMYDGLTANTIKTFSAQETNDYNRNVACGAIPVQNRNSSDAEEYESEDEECANTNIASEGRNEVKVDESAISECSMTVAEFWSEMLPKKLKSKQNANQPIVVAREYTPKIRDVLLVSNCIEKCTKHGALLNQMRFIPAELIYPTAISSAFWYRMLNMPAILWRLENLFNIIDIRDKFRQDFQFYERKMESSAMEESKVDHQSIPLSIEFDLKYLWESLCNFKSMNIHTFEKLETLGDAILGFLVTLFLFFTKLTINEGQLTDMKKDIVRNSNLSVIGKKFGLVSHGVFEKFSFVKWHPSYFRLKKTVKKDSLYYNIKVNDKLPADLVESLIGALFCSKMEPNSMIVNDNKENESDLDLNENKDEEKQEKLEFRFSNAINECFRLIYKFNLLGSGNTFFVAKDMFTLKTDYKNNSFSKYFMNAEIKDKIQNLKSLCFSSKNIHPLLDCCLLEIVDRNYSKHPKEIFEKYGLTFQRLEYLGDAILQILVTWFVYYQILILPQIEVKSSITAKYSNLEKNKMKSLKNISWPGYITHERSIFVNNNTLGFRVLRGNIHRYIAWDDNQKLEISAYVQRVIKWQLKKHREDQNEHKNNDDVDDDYKLVNILETAKTPGSEFIPGQISDDPRLWPKSVSAPKCLGDTFEALLATVFLDSNLHIFGGETNMKAEYEWNFQPCEVFLTTFLGNYINWKSMDWKKWIPNEF